MYISFFINSRLCCFIFLLLELKMRFILLLCYVMLLSACKEEPPHYNGYIDADLIYLSSNYNGRLAHLNVRRGDVIQQNQLLFKVEQQTNNFSVTMSRLKEQELQAQKDELEHQKEYDVLNYQRIIKMRKKDAASQNDLEVAHTSLEVLNDKLAALDLQIKNQRVSVQEQEWERSRKEGYAPQEGIIFDSYLVQGEYAQAGQPIVSLITPQQMKVIFFIPEPELKNTALQEKVTIYSGTQQIGRATINYISSMAQYTPPIIYSRENSHNLVFRVEGRIDNPDLKQLHLGQPISLERVNG